MRTILLASILAAGLLGRPALVEATDIEECNDTVSQCMLDYVIGAATRWDLWNCEVRYIDCVVDALKAY